MTPPSCKTCSNDIHEAKARISLGRPGSRGTSCSLRGIVAGGKSGTLARSGRGSRGFEETSGIGRCGRRETPNHAHRGNA